MTRAPVPLPEAGLMTRTTPAAVGALQGRHPQRVGDRDACLDDRRDDPGARDRDRGAEAEPGQHVAGVVRARGDAGDADHSREQGQAEADGGALQADADGERRRAGGVPRRQ